MALSFRCIVKLLKQGNYILCLCLYQFLLLSCDKDIPDIHPPENDNIIINSIDHAAFPDLIWYKNYWYVSFRISDAHVLGTYSKIKVMRSSDFNKWIECNSYDYKGFDLRDPKFSYNELTDSLYLHFHAASEVGRYAAIRKNIYVSFNKESLSFKQDSSFHFMKMHVQFPNDWNWRPVWYKGNMYVGGYGTGNLRFYKYENFRNPPVVFSTLVGNNSTEATFTFCDKNIYCIVRRANDTFFCTLSDSILDGISDNNPLINIEWKSLPIPQFGGPNMVIFNNKAYMGGRIIQNKTAIITYSLLNQTIDKIEELYSYGDNSYPGMILKGNHIYGVYYTQTENMQSFQIRSFIYSIKNEK